MELSRGSKVLLFVLLFSAALVGGAVLALISASEEPGQRPDEGAPVTVEIPEGVGADEVAEILAAEGVIERPWSFRLMARFDGRASRIRPGAYDLEVGMGSGEILDELADGPPLPDSFQVTVPEGLTVEQTLERIAEADGSPYDVEELEEALVGVPLPDWVPVDDLPDGAQVYEGLLFPATYEHFVDSPAQEVLAEMIGQTDGVLAAVEAQDDRSRYELLTIASLIEREVRVEDERELVSSVVRNRLAEDMRLQIDATVQYARGEHAGRLVFDDLEIDSAWNTYETDGLPPTPIAAPGRAAIEAAANPADTDYRFYVVCDTDTGEHTFAESLDTHQQNVARYREIQEDGGRVCED